MPRDISRRHAVKQIGAAGAGAFLTGGILRGQTADIRVAGRPVEIAVVSLSPSTVRLSVLPIEGGRPSAVPLNGGLAQPSAGKPAARSRNRSDFRSIRAGDLVVRFTDDPPALHVETSRGVTVQKLTLDAETAGVSFLLPKGPLLGLGEGGPQFDRKHSATCNRIARWPGLTKSCGSRAPSVKRSFHAMR
jgi:alpha-glucosidase